MTRGQFSKGCIPFIRLIRMRTQFLRMVLRLAYLCILFRMRSIRLNPSLDSLFLQQNDPTHHAQGVPQDCVVPFFQINHFQNFRWIFFL